MTRKRGKSLTKRRNHEVVPLTPADLGIGTKQLGTRASYRHELHAIYQAVARGELQPAIGTKLSWMVGQMRVAKRDEISMELMEKGGISGVPFAGIVLIGPGAGENDG